MEILKTINLKKYYGQGASLVKALDGVNLSVEEGEFLAVVGTSGSGKSTLLHMLGGLDYATSGEVIVDGKEIFKLNESDLTIFRRRNIGFIFQNYNLVSILNVYENIVLPIELDGEKPDRAFVREITETAGYGELGKKRKKAIKNDNDFPLTCGMGYVRGKLLPGYEVRYEKN